MIRRFMWTLALALPAVGGCGDDPDGRRGDADVDGDVIALGECIDDADCEDGLFCNGVERCMVGAPGADARGCLSSPVSRCAEDERCDESTDECLGRCDDRSDADGDGHDAIACGGGDCDDGNARIHPDAAEICDADGNDEDCDPYTFGGDEDEDGYSPPSCCNAQPDATLLCGTDCDDTRAGTNEAATESCNGVDDDCDGAVDEAEGGGTLTRACSTACGTGTETCSGGSYGGCTAPPVPSESCNGVDDDCDGTVDESDGGGALTRPCSTACGTGTETCSGGSYGGCTAPPVLSESCNGVDDDCDGSVDEGLSSTPVAAFAESGTGITSYTCNANALMTASLTDWTGLDNHGGAYDTIDGRNVTGCVTVDFGSASYRRVDIEARPVYQACSRACGAGYCGTRRWMLVFRGTLLGNYSRVEQIDLTTSAWRTYSVSLPAPTRYVVICRTGAGPNGDDVAVRSARAYCAG